MKQETCAGIFFFTEPFTMPIKEESWLPPKEFMVLLNITQD